MKNISRIVLGLIISILLVSCEYQANKVYEKKRFEPEIAEADSIVVVFYAPREGGYIRNFIDSAFVITDTNWISLLTMHINDSTVGYYSCCGLNGELFGMINNSKQIELELTLDGHLLDYFDSSRVIIIPNGGYNFFSYISRKQWDRIIGESKKLFMKEYHIKEPSKVRRVIDFCESMHLPLHCPNRNLCLEYDGYFLFEKAKDSLSEFDLYWSIRNLFNHLIELDKDTIRSNEQYDTYTLYCNKDNFINFNLYKKITGFITYESDIKVFNYTNDFSRLEKVINGKRHFGSE
ncbi:MAG: hypothetical protein CVU05_04165 [Bacteroidetes bacterium HGW-Bacteroidetes-21]|jgi:hypothetical protein|nr:MAG: hypothetical protein CVU05_04165 [Bacteroidetes bacterium HGW-Bacteroidetes-21]